MLFAITDIETTGDTLARGGITEICVSITNGVSVLDTFTTLLNPGIPIHPQVVQLTGITQAMVSQAPTFAEIASKLYKMYDGCIFVAHNVNFDYRFIENEYKKLNLSFHIPRLCTIKLARQVFPNLPSYSLGKLSHSLGIQHTQVHRAQGDVNATIALFYKVFASISGQKLQSFITRASQLPPHINEYEVSKLPEKPGIYRFLNEQQKVIYIGKATNIKKRVLQHFSKAGKHTEIGLLEIKQIEHLQTGSDFLALITEANEIEAKWPKWNVSGKNNSKKWSLVYFNLMNGLKRIELIPNMQSADSPYIFKNKLLGETLLNTAKNAESICVFMPQFASEFCETDCYCHFSEKLRIEEHNKRLDNVWNALHYNGNIHILIADGTTIQNKSYAIFKNSLLHSWGIDTPKAIFKKATNPDLEFNISSSMAQSIALQYLQHNLWNPNSNYTIYKVEKNKVVPCT